MWKKLKAGTLIAIPGDNDQYLVGQILIPGITFYMQVHDLWVHDLSDCYKALESPILLFGETTDGDLCREKWKVCGEAPCPSRFFQPYHAVNSPDGLVVCDFNKTVVRQANSEDFDRYGFKTSVSSPVFSNAVTEYAKQGIEADLGCIDAQLVACRSELQLKSST